jgi:hypothetical protein
MIIYSHHNEILYPVGTLFNYDNTAERFEVFTSGSHSTKLGYSASNPQQKGIHPVWCKRADDLLVCGVMPKKVFNILSKEADDNSRSVLPTVKKLQNRKKFLFKATNRLDTDRDISDYLQTYRVRLKYLDSCLNC